MNLNHAISTYFLRVYAAELKEAKERGGWSAFSEATFQTVLIVVLPLYGAAAAGIVLLHASSTIYSQWLEAYRPVVTAGAGLLPLLFSFQIVRSLARKYRDSISNSEIFGTARDRMLVNVQFWIVLAVSIGLPWVAAGVVRIFHR